MGMRQPATRRVGRALIALVTAVGLVFTGGMSAHAALYDPVPNTGTTSGGTDTSMVVGQTLTQVSTGSTHSVGVSSDGNVYAWGRNNYGQLGDGTTTDRSTPALVSRGEIPAGVRIEQVTTGNQFSVALGSDGNVYAWGYNNFGQLGDGTIANQSTPVLVLPGAIPAGVTVEQVSTGFYHSVVLGSDGKMYAWGQNRFSQLGDGTAIDRPTPVLVSSGVIPTGVTVKEVAAGYSHSLALGASGNVYAWGQNRIGELGDGTTTTRDTAVLVSRGAIPAGVAIEQVTAGVNYSVVLGSDGNMYSWGGNSQGMLGDGTTEARSTPVAVLRGAIPVGVTVDQLTTGGHHSVVLGSNGNLYSWGDNSEGMLGDGTTEARSTPVAVLRGAIPVGVTIERFTAGFASSVVLGSDGNLYSFGGNASGKLGDGSTTNRDAPVRAARGQLPDKIVTMVQVSEGYAHSLALGSDGNMYSWGLNDYGQLGDGTATNRPSPVLVSRGAIPSNVAIEQLTTGFGHSVVLGSDGNMYAWGNNPYGQLGDGTETNRSAPVLVSRGAIPSAVAIEQLITGLYHSLVVGSDGKMYSWGQNNFGQLGDDSTTNRDTPVEVLPGVISSDVTIEQVAAGFYHSLMVGSDGNTYSWGNNEHGQLGDGTTTPRETPGLVLRGVIPNDVTIEQVAAGFYYSVVLGSDGNMYSWGQNGDGQLGDGTTTPRETPVKVLRGAIPDGVTIEQLAAGFYYSVVLGSDGNIYSWGDNSFGQLGDGTTTPMETPVKVLRGAIPDGVTIGQLAAGAYHSAGVGSDGNLYAWGENASGQLGDGTTTNRSTPVLTLFTETVTGVTFDWLPATDVSQVVDGAITAVTPAHPAGRVDVAVNWSLNGVPQPEMVRPQSFTYVAPPVFVTDPADLEVAEGTTGQFTVAAGPADTVMWQVSEDAGGVWNPVVPTADLVVSADGLTLTVLGDDSTDGNQYRAVATNSVASTNSAAATLTVVHEPGFVTNPADQTIAEGNDAVFTVATDVAATVTWESAPSGSNAWVPVVSGTGVTVSPDGLILTVTGTTANDGSRYRAVASNFAGTVTSSGADLRLIEAPTVITDPDDQAVGSGSTAQFVVEVERADTVTWEVSVDAGVQWNPVTIGAGVSVSADGLTLDVVASPANDGHLYRAVASNIAGTVLSDPALLTVVATPGFITNPADQTVAEGQDVVFTVVPDAVSTVVWETSADGGASWGSVTLGAGVTQSADGLELTVTGTVLNDGDQYRAVATNVGGTNASDAATLTVVAESAFTRDPSDQEVVLGDPAVFTVATDVPATVTWQMSTNNRSSWVPVVPGADVIVSANGLTLTVTGSVDTDLNYYRAVATNIAGVAWSASAQLRVITEPVFITNPADQTIAIGDTAVFEVDTAPVVPVSWQVSADTGVKWNEVVLGDGVTVSTGGLVLQVVGTSVNTGHRYRAVASNIAGTVTSGAAMLTVVSDSGPDAGADPDADTGTGADPDGGTSGADGSGAGAGAGAGGGAGASDQGAGANAEAAANTDGNGATNPGGTLTETGFGGIPTVFWVLVLLMSVAGGGIMIRRNRKLAEDNQ